MWLHFLRQNKLRQNIRFCVRGSTGGITCVPYRIVSLKTFLLFFCSELVIKTFWYKTFFCMFKSWLKYYKILARSKIWTWHEIVACIRLELCSTMMRDKLEKGIFFRVQSPKVFLNAEILVDLELQTTSSDNEEDDDHNSFRCFKRSSSSFLFFLFLTTIKTQSIIWVATTSEEQQKCKGSNLIN